MTNLTIGSETFKVLVEGDATRPPLMLSNSLGTDLSMWDGQIPALVKHFRVIRYDPRGHGGSQAGDTPASIARLGLDALAILDALEIDKVHWLGLSMGGAVGLWLLVNAPERIARAVLANTAARLGTPETWNARITSVLSDGMDNNAEATIERWFSPAYAARDPDQVGSIRKMLRGAAPQSYASSCAALRDMDLRASLGVITHEVLVVTGRDDPVIPQAEANTLTSGISGARHVVLDARHMSNIEAATDFNTAVVTFLTRPVRKVDEARPKSRPPRKTAATKAAPVKRGGASRRSNPARTPLKTPAKKTAARKAKLAREAAGAHRRPAAKRSAARVVAKAAPKKTVSSSRKPAKKATQTRRVTPTASARGKVKKTTPVKRAAAKTAAKKAPTKAPTKKLPAPRRRAVKKPRRPGGLRKS